MGFAQTSSLASPPRRLVRLVAKGSSATEPDSPVARGHRGLLFASHGWPSTRTVFTERHKVAGVRPDLLPAVADISAAKQGRYLPGSRIPVISPQQLLNAKPDRVMVLPWNLKSEVMQQLAGVRQWDGKFVTAIPHLQAL